MQKKLITTAIAISVFFVALLYFALEVRGQKTVALEPLPSEVEEFARTRGLSFVKRYASGNLKGTGFGSVEEVNKITISPIAFKINRINPERLEQDPKSLAETTFPSSEWDFVLSLDGTPKGWLKIGKVDGEFRIFRYAPSKPKLPGALHNLEVLSQQTGKAVEGYPKLFAFGSSEFLVIQDESGDLVLPISDKIPELRSDRLYKTDEIVGVLKEKYRQSKQWKEMIDKQHNRDIDK